jgi:hypothetical protein
MTPELDEALGRLSAALGQLEVAVGRRLDIDNRRADLETELQLMGDDRARLAVDLESATARLHRLEAATDHIGRRLHVAIGTLRDVVGFGSEPDLGPTVEA